MQGPKIEHFHILAPGVIISFPLKVDPGGRSRASHLKVNPTGSEVDPCVFLLPSHLIPRIAVTLIHVQSKQRKAKAESQVWSVLT